MFFRKLRVAVSILTRTVLPAVTEVYYAYVRNQKTVVDNVRRQLLPTVLAFLANSIVRSLSSVQRGITFPLSLRVIKKESSRSIEVIDYNVPEKSVEVNVLSQPQNPKEIVADIIFIHGLHGGLDKTWKQGEWTEEQQPPKHDLLTRSRSEGDIEMPTTRRASLKRTVSDISPLVRRKIAKIDNSMCVNHENDDDKKSDVTHKEYSDCWPRDWLCKDCPGVRVIAVNYTTDILWRPVWIKKRNR